MLSEEVISRASLSPMAIVCFGLVTIRPDPLFSVPCFFRRIVDSTFLDADFPYFAMRTFRLYICKSCADEVMRASDGAASQLDRVLGYGRVVTTHSL